MADPPMPSNRLGLRGKECSAWHSLARLDIRTGSARRCPMVRLVWALICPRLDQKAAAKLSAARVTIWGAAVVVWVGERDKLVARSEKCTSSDKVLVVTRGMGWVRGIAVMASNAIYRARWAQIGRSAVVGETKRTVAGVTMAARVSSLGHFVQINVESCFLQDNWLFTG